MKVGLIVHFFDFRNDVRQWIFELKKQMHLVLFVRPQDKELIQAMMPEGIEIRLIDEKKPSLWNRVWEWLFRMIGQLPQSRQNYYLMEAFRISIINQGPKAQSAFRMLNFSMSLPRILSYDFFISQLQLKKNTNLEGIDRWLCFTELSDNYLMKRLLEEGKAPLVYVYSWDHPCKHTRFSKRMQYLVWHQGIANDLIQLQHIPAQNIRIWGASQMGFVKNWLDKKDSLSNPYPFPYLYFGCAIGVAQLVENELEMVRLVARKLSQIAPDWKLVVRPYPVMKDWSPYDALREIPNLVIDDGFRAKKTETIAVDEDFIMEKFVKIHFSKGFLHLGTTLGIEACYTQAPSILLDLKEYSFPENILSLHHFIHQYQNDKYLNLSGFQNVVKSEKALDELLRSLLNENHDLLAYNKMVASDLEPVTFAQLASDFKSLISSNS